MPKYEVKVIRTQYATMVVEADNIDIIDEAWDNDLVPDDEIDNLSWDIDEGTLSIERTELLSHYSEASADLVIELERQIKVTRARHLSGAVR